MPARPAPRITTEAPFGSPSSLTGPLYPDSEARPSAVIASYIAALPATVPISASRSRRLGALEASLCIAALDWTALVRRQAYRSLRGHGSSLFGRIEIFLAQLDRAGTRGRPAL